MDHQAALAALAEQTTLVAQLKSELKKARVHGAPQQQPDNEIGSLKATLKARKAHLNKQIRIEKRREEMSRLNDRDASQERETLRQEKERVQQKARLLRQKARRLEAVAKDQAAKIKLMLKWRQNLEDEKAKLDKKHPGETTDYSALRNNVDDAFASWAAKQPWAKAPAPQIDNNGQQISMADIDAAYSQYVAREAGEKISSGDMVTIAEVQRVMGKDAAAVIRNKANTFKAKGGQGASASVQVRPMVVPTAPQAAIPPTAIPPTATSAPGGALPAAPVQAGHKQAKQADWLGEFFGEQREDDDDDDAGGAFGGTGHEMHKPPPPPKPQSAGDKFLSSMLPKGFHMARVCDKNGCMNQAVADGGPPPRAPAAPQVTPLPQEATPPPQEATTPLNASPQGGPMSDIDKSFEKWKKKKGITMTFEATPPATHTVGGQVTGTPGLGG